MAKDGGGGGSAFGWTLLGFLAGIAATLGIQMLMSPKETPPREVATAPAAVHVVVSSAAPAPAPVKKAVASAAPAASAAPIVSHQAAEEVADDAAAAGMTTRITPSHDTATDTATSNN
jgi:hypothetical protein